MRLLSTALALLLAAPAGATRIAAPKVKTAPTSLPAARFALTPPALSADLTAPPQSAPDALRTPSVFIAPTAAAAAPANARALILPEDPVGTLGPQRMSRSAHAPGAAIYSPAKAGGEQAERALGAAIQGRGAREHQAATAEAIWRQWEDLESARANNAFAKRRGIAIKLTSFEAGKLLGLDGDNLAQMEIERGEMMLNWDMVGPDLGSFLRYGAEGYQIAGRLLAPIASHEARHARLRDEFGGFVPPTREEEILTHADQALAYEETLRNSGPAFASLDSFIGGHQRRVAEFWNQGWSAFVGFVLRKNDGLPSLNEGPEANVRRALKALAEIEAEPAKYPSVWRERWRQALAFWRDEAAYARLVEMLRPQFETAERLAPRRR